MPEIEIRNCTVRNTNGFRISSGKRVLIENCRFENAGFCVLFSGDMNYWFENTGVKDVTIRSCVFERCGSPVLTGCGFRPTEKAPFYHENIRFFDNLVRSPGGPALRLDNVNNVEIRGNRFEGLGEGMLPVVLNNCSHVTLEP